MDVPWMAAHVLMLLVLLLEGVKDADAADVACYQCSYYTQGDTTVTQACTEMKGCKFCQTRVYRDDSTELVERDCVARCSSSGVPVRFDNIKDESADEMCCTSDLCNIHPSSGAPRTRSLRLLVLLPTLLLTIKALHPSTL